MNGLSKEPVLLIEGYRGTGYNVVGYGGSYYAVAQGDGPFDIERIAARSYNNPAYEDADVRRLLKLLRRERADASGGVFQEPPSFVASSSHEPLSKVDCGLNEHVNRVDCLGALNEMREPANKRESMHCPCFFMRLKTQIIWLRRGHVWEFENFDRDVRAHLKAILRNLNTR
jgi:hypothetical protein